MDKFEKNMTDIFVCAAPKKKQEKMSLGDFLGDQCARHPLRLAQSRKTVD
jgi:hypothetical protein